MATILLVMREERSVALLSPRTPNNSEVQRWEHHEMGLLLWKCYRGITIGRNRNGDFKLIGQEIKSWPIWHWALPPSVFLGFSSLVGGGGPSHSLPLIPLPSRSKPERCSQWWALFYSTSGRGMGGIWPLQCEAALPWGVGRSSGHWCPWLWTRLMLGAGNCGLGRAFLFLYPSMGLHTLGAIISALTHRPSFGLGMLLPPWGGCMPPLPPWPGLLLLTKEVPKL